MLKQLLLALCFAWSAWAAEVRLAWDANTEPDLVGYRIHYGTASGSYTNHVDVGNVTTYLVPGLADGVRYYFAATAYNATGESGYSNEVNWASEEPAPYIGATALTASRYQVRKQQMAVEYISTITINSDSQSIDVPTDANFAVFSQLTFSPFDPSPPSVTLNAVAFTNAFIGGSNRLSVAYLVNPSTGSQTLASVASEYWRRISFFKGVNTSDPIADSGDAEIIDGSLTGLSYSTGDMMLGIASDYYDTPTLSANSQNEIFTIADRGGAAYKASTGDFYCPDGGSVAPTMPIFAMVIAASGGGSSAVPKIMLLQDHFSGGVH